MLRSPRPIPRRYSRRVTKYTKAVVRKYHRPRRRYNWERLRRGMQRWQEKMRWAGERSLQSFWWIVGVILLGIVLITLFSPLLTVREIRVARRDPRIDVELVEQALRPLFGKRMLFVREQDVLPLLSAELPAVKRSAVPDLQTIALGKEYPSTLVLELEPERIVASLRILQPGQTEPAVQTGSNVLEFLTERGLLAQYLPSEAQVPSDLPEIEIVDWGARPLPWRVIFEPEVLQEMRKAEVILLEQFGQAVTRRAFYLRAQEYHFVLDDDLTIWLDRRSPVEEQLARYQLFIQVTPRGAAKQYVDLRLNDRIVYR